MSHRIRRTAVLTVAAFVTLAASAHGTQPITVPAALPSATIWFNAKSGAAGTPSPARISTELTRVGKRRVLTWWVLRQGGQRVTFEEFGPTGNRVLGFTRGGSGSVRFRPAKGAGLHRIIARVQVTGVTTEGRTVARFRVRRG